MKYQKFLEFEIEGLLIPTMFFDRIDIVGKSIWVREKDSVIFNAILEKGYNLKLVRKSCNPESKQTVLVFTFKEDK